MKLFKVHQYYYEPRKRGVIYLSKKDNLLGK